MPDVRLVYSSFNLKDVSLRNRIAIPADVPVQRRRRTDQRLASRADFAGLARGGAGLVIVEATAVSPEGRNYAGLHRPLERPAGTGLLRPSSPIRAAGAVPGIQLAHAGRKASANRPWEGGNHIAADDPRGWQTIAPSSAIAFGDHLPSVHQGNDRFRTSPGCARISVAAAKRARDAGFEWPGTALCTDGYLRPELFLDALESTERRLWWQPR